MTPPPGLTRSAMPSLRPSWASAPLKRDTQQRPRDRVEVVVAASEEAVEAPSEVLADAPAEALVEAPANVPVDAVTEAVVEAEIMVEADAVVVAETAMEAVVEAEAVEDVVKAEAVEAEAVVEAEGEAAAEVLMKTPAKALAHMPEAVEEAEAPMEAEAVVEADASLEAEVAAEAPMLEEAEDKDLLQPAQVTKKRRGRMVRTKTTQNSDDITDAVATMEGSAGPDPASPVGQTCARDSKARTSLQLQGVLDWVRGFRSRLHFFTTPEDLDKDEASVEQAPRPSRTGGGKRGRQQPKAVLQRRVAPKDPARPKAALGPPRCRCHWPCGTPLTLALATMLSVVLLGRMRPGAGSAVASSKELASLVAARDQAEARLAELKAEKGLLLRAEALADLERFSLEVPKAIAGLSDDDGLAKKLKSYQRDADALREALVELPDADFHMVEASYSDVVGRWKVTLGEVRKRAAATCPVAGTRGEDL